MSTCMGCFRKQQEINRLQWENGHLKARLRTLERSATEGPFGASTPSSKVPIKPSALAERQARRGGRKPGHAGRGRRSVSADTADRVERVALDADTCPHCGVPLESAGADTRTVTDMRPARVEKVLLHLERKRCRACGRRYRARPTGMGPRSLYTHGLLAHVAEQHYVHGMPMGVIARQTGIAPGALWPALGRVAATVQGAVASLVAEYRKAPVRHADETGWRTDGQNGYAWLFATPTLSLFRLRTTRSAAVPAEVLGTERLPGVLVVDRYHAYNRAPVPLQYCYSHLKRDTEDLRKTFPDDPEVAAFVSAFVPALSEAMTLRTLGLPRSEFLSRAARAKRRILALVRRPARHPAIQKIQNIFRKHKDRLYHWARDPAIPAENNRAERDLRPLVVARKVSFGSQSPAGAQTREILLTILHTLKKRGAPLAATLQAALDQLVKDPSLDPYALLFSPSPPQAPRPPP